MSDPIRQEAVAALAEVLDAHAWADGGGAFEAVHCKEADGCATEILAILAANPDAARRVAAALVPEGLDVERLQEALFIVGNSVSYITGDDVADIAREYANLRGVM